MVIVLIAVVSGALFLVKNDIGKSKVVDNFYINSVNVNEKTNYLAFDVRKTKNENITLEYSYAYWVEVKEDGEWKNLNLNIPFPLPLFFCELDCQLERTNLAPLANNPKLKEGKEYRIAKNVSDYIFYSEFKIEEGLLYFVNKNSIEKIK